MQYQEINHLVITVDHHEIHHLRPDKGTFERKEAKTSSLAWRTSLKFQSEEVPRYPPFQHLSCFHVDRVSSGSPQRS